MFEAPRSLFKALFLLGLWGESKESAAGMPHFELYHFLCQFRAGHANHCRDYVTMFSGKQMLFIALSLQYSFNSVKTKEDFKDFFVHFFNIEKPTITNVLS